jgi:hypothetical protein
MFNQTDIILSSGAQLTIYFKRLTAELEIDQQVLRIKYEYAIKYMYKNTVLLFLSIESYSLIPIDIYRNFIEPRECLIVHGKLSIKYMELWQNINLF